MRKLKLISKIIVLTCTMLLFVNCDNDTYPQDFETNRHLETDKISFKDFLIQTKIKDFEFNIKPLHAEDKLSQQTSSNIAFTQFTVDTLMVKQLLKGGNSTFTLSVTPNPYPNNPNFYYNIVFYKIDSNYVWSILEFEKKGDDVLVTEILNETNKDNLNNVSSRLNTSWVTITVYHCTNTGKCLDTGICDRCNLCITHYTIKNSVEVPDREFLTIADTPGSPNSNGGGISVGNTFSPAVNSAINNFKNTLTPLQLSIYNVNKNDFDTYLKNNSITTIGSLGQSSCFIFLNSKQFLIDFINLAIEHNIEFISNFEGGYKKFANLSELEDFVSYEKLDTTISNASNFDQDKILVTRTVELNPLCDLLIELVITPSPNFSIDQTNSKTDISSPLPGNDWIQNSITVTKNSMDFNNNLAEVTISGYILVGIKIDTFSKGLKLRKHVIVRINKTNGSINYSEVKNIN